ncbi:MAG: hypothetical protein ABI785_09350, partial [Gemmatimonadales bacterium]
NRALLRGMLAGAVVLTGAACSRSDRAKSGPDNTAAIAPDTGSNIAQPSNSGTMTGAVSDTATPSDRSSSSTQPTSSAPSNAPRAETAAPSEKDAAGYQSMERDTASPSNQHSDSARVTADTSVSQAAPVTSDSATTEMSASGSASADVADTAAAGYAEMARDTSTVADQADTAAANGDVALKATVDTSSEANADLSAGAGAADSTDNAGRIRPPEDSTEILGNVSTNEGDETADEQVVRPEDRATVATSETPNDEVGAAAIGGEATGAEAVALLTREGLRCAVVNPEANQAVRWDMSSTPIALNPCGMGSMVLSRIWTRVE